MERRSFMRLGFQSVTVAVAGSGAVGLLGACTPPPDPGTDGLVLLPGFTARVVAVSGRPVAGTGYTWHPWPDGGATFATPDGGWIYVSNSEVPVNGGAGALRFDANGAIVDAYRILSGTVSNCAGGATSSGTWLSCEEVGRGRVFECDPFGVAAAVERPALGRFKHEAAAEDPSTGVIYLSEDEPTGALYRMVPDTAGDLSAGRLDVLVETGGALAWVEVPDPTGATTPTRNQVPGTKRFDGGEGIVVRDGVVYLGTKGDNRVWAFDIASEALSVVYDAATSADPDLTGVDNIALLPGAGADGLLVAEDGGNLELVAVGLDGSTTPVVRLDGVPGTELTGPAFDPSGTRLYFSSQRSPGVTYEVSGDWSQF
jgi:secreted PhoX family phosphatase